MKTLTYMDRATTDAIKGLALICMFAHHFFTFPSFLIEGISYPWMQEFADDFCVPFKICVPVFAFLTGYFYAFSSRRTFGNSIRKITDLYLSYWAVYLVLLAVSVALGCYGFSVYCFVYEMTAIRTDIMVFCWYLLFYTCSMILLPLLTRSREASAAEDVLLLLILPVVVTDSLKYFQPQGIPQMLLSYIHDWFPCIACGYLCAKYAVFENFFDRAVNRFESKACRILIDLILIAAAMMGRYYCQFLHFGTLEIRGGMFSVSYTADIFYGPMFVYGCGKLLQSVKESVFIRILGKIGQQSMLMWFFHCAFFNVTRDVFQPILYWPRNPVLVLIWGLLLCWIPSIALDPLIRVIRKQKDRILRTIH